MMFTELTYQQIGGVFSAIFIITLAFVIVYRLIMAFRHYVYHGDFGDGEKSAFVSLMEGEWSNVLKYAFTGYHPGMIIADAFFLTLFSLLQIVAWGPEIIIGLFLFLAHTMRKRIAHKQEFTARLEGTHEE